MPLQGAAVRRMRMSKWMAVTIQATLAVVCGVGGLWNLWLFDEHETALNLIVGVVCLGVAAYAAVVGGKISASEYWK